MSRFIVIAAIAAFVIAVPMTHTADAGGNTKVDVCHVNSANSPGTVSYDYGTTYSYPYQGYSYSNSVSYTYHVGKVISVDESAVQTHVDDGDSTWFYESDDLDWIESLEDYSDSSYTYTYYVGYPYYTYYTCTSWTTYDNTNGVNKNANCYWWVYN